MSNISKLNLGERKGLNYDDRLQTKTIRNWIKENPKFIFLSVYQSYKHGLERLNLGREAIIFLKEQLQKKGYNKFVEEINKKQKVYSFNRKIKNLVRKS